MSPASPVASRPAWAQAPAQPAFQQGETIADLLADNGLVLAIGGSVDGPVAWYSADGLAWSRAPLEGTAYATLDVARGGPGYVAAGFRKVAVTRPRMSGSGVAFWTSTDGRSWLSVPDQAAFEAGAWSNEVRLASGPAGLVAVARACTLDTAGDPGACSPRAWRSADGVHWTRIDSLPALPPRANDFQVGGVAVLGDRYVVTALSCRLLQPTGGGDALNHAECARLTWLSTDLLHWTQTVDPQPGNLQGIQAASGPSSTILAISGDASSGRESVQLYDGEAWRTVRPVSAFATPASVVSTGIRSFVGTPDGWYAFASGCDDTNPPASPNCVSGLIRSRDGVQWTEVAPLDGVGLATSFAVLGTRIVMTTDMDSPEAPGLGGPPVWVFDLSAAS